MSRQAKARKSEAEQYPDNALERLVYTACMVCRDWHIGFNACKSPTTAVTEREAIGRKMDIRYHL